MRDVRPAETPAASEAEEEVELDADADEEEERASERETDELLDRGEASLSRIRTFSTRLRGAAGSAATRF